MDLKQKKLDKGSREIKGSKLHFLREYVITSKDGRLTQRKHCRITWQQ